MSKLLRVLVALLVTATIFVTAAQSLPGASPWWLELSRYLPYPLFLAPALFALALSVPLGRSWLATSAAALTLVAVVTMDLHWHGPPGIAVPGTPQLRLMTYNVKAYKAQRHRDGVAALAREVALHHPDILVMQDTQSDTDEPVFASGGPIFGLPHVFIATQYVVASRYPLQGCRLRHTEPPYLEYVNCTVQVGGGWLNLVTAHFESPRQGLVATRRDGLDGVEDWRQNYLARLLQARALAADLEGISGPLVVAGDLNAPNASPVVRSLFGIGLRDAFSQAGNGYGYSYGHALRLGFSFLRIDHILVSPTIGVLDCSVGNPEPSEHRPVIADLVLPR